MLKRITIISAIVAMATFAAAMPAPDNLAFAGNTDIQTVVKDDTNKSDIPGWREGLKTAAHDGGAASVLGFVVGKTNHKADTIIDSAKETAEDAWTTTKDTTKKAVNATGNAIAATGHALATTGKVIVGGIILTGEGLVKVTKEGAEKLGDFTHAAGEKIRIIIRPLSPSNIKEKVTEGAIRVRDAGASLVHDFVCNYKDGYAMVYEPESEKSYCVDKDGKNLGPAVPRSDTDTVAEEYEVSAAEAA
ncbi:hypothetical protein BDF19DRAFT_433912 [Syncephalis fuscata]|nr:hypothetical protein BDF19DRAFT_433912 [Syncephalis fuscata]